MEEPKAETQRPDQPRPETKEGPVQAKRKYRRHPKVRVEQLLCMGYVY